MDLHVHQYRHFAKSTELYRWFFTKRLTEFVTSIEMFSVVQHAHAAQEANFGQTLQYWCRQQTLPDMLLLIAINEQLQSSKFGFDVFNAATHLKRQLWPDVPQLLVRSWLDASQSVLLRDAT